MSGRKFGRLRMASLALAALAVGLLGAQLGGAFQSTAVEWGAPTGHSVSVPSGVQSVVTR
ncbi:hypothetical protein [Micromonospora luteifusca]|uniref:Uncharacterized protein n=1 Tax=Micromonospora luteifusca TaxID=709860 RepID=A0ABS2LS09_9ACTN|nr:hypothetical protein [Micromonospora luteifusca]MBM7490968.1 hypothetical protein [Micromonospora luteifusca]